MISAGLATAGEAIFDLDFHAVMHWGQEPRPGKALRPVPVPARPLSADLLRPGHRHPQPRLRKRRHLSKATQNREAIAFCDHWKQVSGSEPEDADHGPEGHHPGCPRRTGCPRRQVRHPPHALTIPGEVHQRPGQQGLQDRDPGPARPAQPAPHPRGPRRDADQLSRHRPPAHRHRPRPRRPHRHHHQRRPHQDQGTHTASTPAA